jgi:DNA-binding NtrC family response regulator
MVFVEAGAGADTAGGGQGSNQSMAGDANRVVLVVEDDPIIAFDLETILKELSCEAVVIFSDNRGAIQWLDGQSPHCAILDFKLTSENSLDTAHLLARRDIPTAFVTGYGAKVPLPDTLARCEIFNKPISKTDLEQWLARVNEALRTS